MTSHRDTLYAASQDHRMVRTKMDLMHKEGAVLLPLPRVHVPHRGAEAAGGCQFLDAQLRLRNMFSAK
jgi:hypothetical protein